MKVVADLPLREATDADFDGIMRLLAHAFAEDFPDDQREVERLTFEPERNHVIVDGDRIVANAGAYTRDVTVPGGSVPCAHVTLVGVAATYRRRGLLRRLMTHQLRDVARRGEPVATLWASEGAIYQRFGYGLAALRLALDCRSAGVLLRRPDAAGPGEVTRALRDADPETARADLEAVYGRQLPHRPGWSDRSPAWWRYRLADPQSRRNGATGLRSVVHSGQNGADGYALYRVKPGWDTHGPQGTVQVEEVVAENPAAYRELWRFLLTVDLTRSVLFRYGAVDEPLVALAGEPRALGGRISDGLWLRIVDVPGALAARRYQADVDVVLELTDDLLPANAGRWRLRAGPDRATCERTGAPADLGMDVAALGAAYLGGPTLHSLAAGGRVRVAGDRALDAASAAFGWHRAPAVTESF